MHDERPERGVRLDELGSCEPAERREQSVRVRYGLERAEQASAADAVLERDVLERAVLERAERALAVDVVLGRGAQGLDVLEHAVRERVGREEAVNIVLGPGTVLERDMAGRLDIGQPGWHSGKQP